jgi:hypothetical protein
MLLKNSRSVVFDSGSIPDAIVSPSSNSIRPVDAQSLTSEFFNSIGTEPKQTECSLKSGTPDDPEGQQIFWFGPKRHFAIQATICNYRST